MTVLEGFQGYVVDGYLHVGKSDLYIVQNGTLTAAQYVNEILDMLVRTYACDIGNHFTLMYENARPHRARVTNDYLRTAIIERMDWPVRPKTFIQLNVPGKRCRLHYLSAKSSLSRLKSSNTRYWTSRLGSRNKRIQWLFSGMRRRCPAVIQTNGHHT